MSAVENISPVSTINVMAIEFDKKTNTMLYKVVLYREDLTIGYDDQNLPEIEALRSAIVHLEKNPNAQIVVYKDISSSLDGVHLAGKSLPPTLEAQKGKQTMWGKRLRDLINAAWEDGVALSIEYADRIVENEKLPEDWQYYSSCMTIPFGSTDILNKPMSASATTIAKGLVLPEANGVHKYQYFGQYFPTRDEKGTQPVPKPVDAVRKYLDYGNMKYDPSKVEALDLHNPSGKVLHVEPRDLSMPGFQKAFDATVADTGGYITKAVEELFPSETTAVDNSPTATKVK